MIAFVVVPSRCLYSCIKSAPASREVLGPCNNVFYLRPVRLKCCFYCKTIHEAFIAPYTQRPCSECSDLIKFLLKSCCCAVTGCVCHWCSWRGSSTFRHWATCTTWRSGTPRLTDWQGKDGPWRGLEHVRLVLNMTQGSEWKQSFVLDNLLEKGERWRYRGAKPVMGCWKVELFWQASLLGFFFLCHCHL